MIRSASSLAVDDDLRDDSRATGSEPDGILHRTVVTGDRRQIADRFGKTIRDDSIVRQVIGTDAAPACHAGAAERSRTGRHAVSPRDIGGATLDAASIVAEEYAPVADTDHADIFHHQIGVET